MRNLVIGIIIGIFLIPIIKETKIRTRYTSWFKDYNLIEIVFEFFKDVWHRAFFSVW